MGAFQSACNAVVTTDTKVFNFFNNIASLFLDVGWSLGWIFFIIGVGLCITLTIPVFVIVFVVVLLKDFIISILFNWQSLVIIIIIAIMIFVFAIIWSMIRTGVNDGILPGITSTVHNFINPLIRLIKKQVRMVGARAPFDEIDEDSLGEGMPTLLSIVLMVLKPLTDMLLKPLRANKDDDLDSPSYEKCKKE
jgi:hypothetical protein